MKHVDCCDYAAVDVDADFDDEISTGNSRGEGFAALETRNSSAS